MEQNLILDTDSYKTSHFLQYPPGTTNLFGYLESRGGRYSSTLFFGLQGLLKSYLTRPVTNEDVAEAATFCKDHGVPFPREGWQHIVDKHRGYLPLRIRAVPEGSLVPTRNALMTVESTDPRVPWVVGWLETKLMRLWYPITVATRSYYTKRVIFEFLKRTADAPLAELSFKLHDFGGRGGSSRETVAIGGAAHLVNFLGTDTIEGALYAKQYYGSKDKVLGYSIPAMEHSTVTAWGPGSGEEAAFRNHLNAYGQGIVDYPVLAAVSDSYDFYAAVEDLWGDRLLEEVKASGKVIVIRPDSGDPAEVNVRALEILERKVGMEINRKGYKVLPRYYRLIQGDGNDNEDDVRVVLQALSDHGYSASNIAFGMGGGLLQKLDRDTNRFAFKLSQIVVNGETRDVRKAPKTDPTKRSMAGRLDLVMHDGAYDTLVVDPGLDYLPDSEMRTYYEDGNLLYGESFDDIRRRAGREFVG